MFSAFPYSPYMKNKKETQAVLASSLFPLHDYAMGREGESQRARKARLGEKEKLLGELQKLMADPEDEEQRQWCKGWIEWLEKQ